MRRRALTSCLLLTAALGIAACGGKPHDASSTGASGRGSNSATGVVVIDELDASAAGYRRANVTLLEVQGSPRWNTPRLHDGTVRLTLPAGARKVTSYLYVCPLRCLEGKDLVARIGRDSGPGQVLTCSTTVDVQHQEVTWWRARVATDGGSCSWEQQDARGSIAPPDVSTTLASQQPPTMWVEGRYGATPLGFGSYCWSFPGGGGTGCADGIGSDCTGDAFAHAPELDVRPGEALRLHLGVEPTEVDVTLKSTIASRDQVEPASTAANERHERVLKFAAPDDDATLRVFLRHQRGDHSGSVCLRVVGKAEPGAQSTIVTRPSTHVLRSEADARRMFYIDGAGGGAVIHPDTIECEAADRPELGDDPVWACQALAGEVRRGKVLRVRGIVVRDDGGVADRESETVDAPTELVAKPANGTLGAATLESAYGTVEMRHGSSCWMTRCVEVVAPPGCDGPKSPPHLEVHEGDLFAVRLPFTPAGAALYLDEGGRRDTTRPPAQRQAEGRTLVTTFLQLRRTYVTAFARSPRGHATWYARIDPVRDAAG